MHYFRAYGFMFRSKNWLTNMLLVVVCLFIPVVGQLVLIGYMFDVIEYMHRRGRDDDYPDFDFNRLVSYLTRGIWPFLADFLLGMILVPPLAGGYLVVVFMWIGVEQKNLEQETALILTIVIAAVALATLVLVSIIRFPIYLKCGLQQEFGAGFSWSFFWDFFGRVGITALLVLLFEMITAPFVILAGALLCFVGIYPANVVVIYCQHHLLYQLYQEYLREGGTPIPLKAEERPAPHYGEEIVEDPGAFPE
jgi:hypothetical protein